MVDLLEYRYAYLVGNLLLFIIWIIIFLRRKDLRKEQLVVGMILAFVAPLTDYLFFYNDYWRPDYFFNFQINNVRLGFESSFFGFVIGGISTGIYEFVLGRKAIFSKPRNLLAFLVAFINLFGIYVLTNLGLNSIWSSIITLIGCSIYMALKDRDLIKDMIFSSIFITTIIFIFYIVWFYIYPLALHKFWVIDNLSGIKIWRTPIEEIVWFFSAGLFIGTFYEFWRNVRKYKKLS
ncbi:hypothetical protein KBD45_07775 [Candidatus Dojkabacteria bacterium]|nr:hypothetical protein [Candidatus Dojkabacteria bacterium]